MPIVICLGQQLDLRMDVRPSLFLKLLAEFLRGEDVGDLQKVLQHLRRLYFDILFGAYHLLRIIIFIYCPI